jgi:predicted MFS family arabinose efflux permease
VYSIDAGTFMIALVVTFMMAPLPPAGGARRPGLGSIAEGFRFLKGRQVLQGVFLIDINAMVFGMPRALFPAMANGVFHSAGPPAVTLGYLYAAPGVGALVGAVATGWVGRLRRQARAVVLAVMVWGAAIAVFGFVHVLWVGLVLLAVAGWADVISAVLRGTLLQTSIPDHFRSRLSSIQMAVVQGGPRLGDLESGTVAELTSTQFSVVSGGLACIVGAVVLSALLPGFRHHRAGSVPAGGDGSAAVEDQVVEAREGAEPVQDE